MTPTPHHPITPILAAELRAARARARRTIVWCAGEAGVSERTLIRVFKGEKPVDTPTLHRLAIALDTTGAALLEAAERNLA